MKRSTLYVLFFFVALSGFGQKMTTASDLQFASSPNEEARQKDLALFKRSAEPRKDKAINIEVSQQVIQWVWENEPSEFTVRIPLPDGSTQRLSFIRSNIFTDDFSVSTSDGRKVFGKEYQGLHYMVKKGGEVKVGGLSFREGGLMGMFSTGKGNINIGEVSPGKGDYVVSNDADLERPKWACGSENMKSMLDETVRKPTLDKAVTTSCKTVRVWFESDYDMYLKSSNSVTTATTFITGLFNVVAQIYLNEGITVKMSGVFQWTTADPYRTLTDMNNIIYSFATNRPPANINGDITQLLMARSTSLGGIAYVGVFCNTAVRHSVSNIYYQYYSLPNYSWSVYVTSHEMGHNFGSRHTQWCGWTLPGGTTGRIDSCYAGEGTCGSTTRARTGTVMSYCHVTSGGVDFNLGFGTLPGKAIRDGLAAATCISSTGCLGTASLKVDSASNKNNSYILTLSVPASHNATSWQVLEGTTVVQSGTLSGTTAFTRNITISGKANGTYNYTAKLISGASSTTSTSLAVTVSVPTITIISGICTATGLQAWFDATAKVNFKFGLSQTCNTYNVQMCRYNYQNPSIPPPDGATPVACGTRNNMTNYTPTTAERTAGFIQRVASPQPTNMTTPGMGSYWYSMDVTCSGTGCTTTNKTRTYIFVPGI
jgi:hypothetical protein